MPIRFRCKKCEKRVSAPEKMAGRSVPCPNCQTKITVPMPELLPGEHDKQHHEEEEEDEFGSGHGSGGNTEFGELDLTPMVDVTMLLLIFFILTARYIEQKTLPTPAPTAQKKDDASGASSAVAPVEMEDIEEASIMVGIDERNIFTVDDISIAPTDLVEKMKAAQAGGKAELVIDAHPDCLHDSVVQVIDVANSLGIQKIRLTSKGDDD